MRARKRIPLALFALTTVLLLVLYHGDRRPVPSDAFQLQPPAAAEAPSDAVNATTVTRREPEPSLLRGSGSPEARLRRAMSRDPANVKVRTGEDGIRVLDLNGGFSTVAAGRLTADGRIEIACFEEYRALQDFVATTEPAVAGEEDVRRAVK